MGEKEDKMSVAIKEYNKGLRERFLLEKERLSKVLGDNVEIEHVGSSAVGIGGKNIVDILIGVPSADRMEPVRDLLASAGYREGHDTHPDRIFMAFRVNDDGTDRETGEGDLHVHIVVVGSSEYTNMLGLKNYLLAHPDESKKYFEMKEVFAKEAQYDRKTYKALKSKYVSELIEKANEERLNK